MGRNVRKVGGAAVAVLLAVGLAACGDDDEPEADGSGSASAPDEGDSAAGDIDAFCDALVDFNGAVTTVELDETSTEEDIVATGEELAPLGQALADNAPESVSEQAGEFNDIVQALLEGDAEAFNSDATFDSYIQFVGEAVGECDFAQVDVSLVDYGFVGLPTEVDAGTTTFALTNDTEAGEDHEMILLKKADGVTESFDEIFQMSEEESMSKVEFVGAGFAPPGGTGSVLAELTPGEWAAVCFIPVGGAEDGPPHFTQGMMAEFTVG